MKLGEYASYVEENNKKPHSVLYFDFSGSGVLGTVCILPYRVFGDPEHTTISAWFQNPRIHRIAELSNVIQGF